jgi:cation diffusion facilitator family transporter
MAVVVGMYAVKVLAKLTVGRMIGSVAMMGDGLHNVSDIFEAGMVVAVIYMHWMPKSERFPLGRSPIEHLYCLLICLMLTGLGLSVLGTSLVGIARAFGAEVPWFGRIACWEGTAWKGASGWALASGGAVVMGSVAVSFVVSRWQRRVSKETGYPAVGADGAETRSDALCELATLFGPIGFAVGIPHLDRFAGLVVSVFILRIAYAIGREAVLVLLNESLSAEELGRLRRRIETVKGVDEVRSLTAYRVGEHTFVSVLVTTAPYLSKRTVMYLRRAISEIAERQIEGAVRATVDYEPASKERTRSLISVMRFDGMQSVIASDASCAPYIVADLYGDEIIEARIDENACPASQEEAESLLSALDAEQFVVGCESTEPDAKVRRVAAITLEDFLD